VILQDGDILNIDVTTYLNGFHGDTNRTFLVGEVSAAMRKLVDVTYQCMMLGIAQVRPGGYLGDIGAAIQRKARAHGYGVVRDFCGHGIGREFHEDPQVLHYKANRGIELQPGMTFTIEPMINAGKAGTRVLDDGWTAVTIDGKWSAQFEHTILVTESGHEILTAWED
jgi:methionyl aminopeptidase